MCARACSPASWVRYVNQHLVITDLFVHWLLSLTWRELVTVSTLTSLFCILVFGVLFFLLGDQDSMHHALALSTQTYYTIGYGVLGPKTVPGHVIVYFETFIAVTVLVVVTGIPYIKFSNHFVTTI